jgi:predicted RecB family nuclease
MWRCIPAVLRFTTCTNPTLHQALMPFSAAERQKLLAVKGVGPTVVMRLEQMGYENLAHLAKANALDIVNNAAKLLGSTCWKNSPQARTAIQSAISAAHSAQKEPP